MTAALSVVVAVFMAVCLVLWLARPRHCTHPGVQFERSSGLMECPACHQLVEWQDMQP